MTARGLQDLTDKEYQHQFIQVVTDPRFKVMGFTIPELLAVKRFLESREMKVADLAKIGHMA